MRYENGFGVFAIMTNGMGSQKQRTHPTNLDIKSTCHFFGRIEQNALSLSCYFGGVEKIISSFGEAV
jgi:hypothetical protein